jgi:plasmid maintenance system antidote protein VapI
LIEAIKYHMEQKGLSPRDLIPFIGGRNRVYEVLARKRPLTLKMIWRLHKGLGIPAESLIKGGRQQISLVERDYRHGGTGGGSTAASGRPFDG